MSTTAAPHDLPTTGLKPFGLRIPTLANLLDVGLTKAWELCGPTGPIETVKIDGCTIAIYESVEHYIENLRRQKADQRQPLRKGLEQATTASLAARAKRKGRPRKRPAGEAANEGAVTAVRDGAQKARAGHQEEAATK
jgi:hypothetical protein